MLGMLLLSLHSITAAPVLVLVPAANRSFAADAYAALAQALVGRGVDARVADVSDTAPASVIDGAGSDDDPVLVVEGLNHAQFADGRPLDGDLAADLEPAAAIAAVADAVAAFALDAPLDLAATAKFVAPLVAAMELEGSPYLRAPCQSDWPTNPTRAYPRWPDASIGPAAPAPDPLPPADCTCGSPWAYGLDASDDNATDATSLNTCAHINAAAIAWAKAAAAPAALARFEAAGAPLGVAADAEAPIGLTGPTWIKTPPVFRRNDSGVDVTSYSFTIANVRRGDVPFFITAGFHYCKLLSPLKAMEWIYVDGLPRVGAAARAAACERCVDRRDPVNASFAAAHCWLDDGCYAVGDAANPARRRSARPGRPLQPACGGCDDLFCTF
ncbi:hypothetical protein JL720_15955 [Aureococcus anophagefferens]|nr:hypothetical protein JL720_15955 [Aureococcus anophagefferens]